METIRKKLLRKWGYLPSDNEIISLYRQGELVLTDREENSILKVIEAKEKEIDTIIMLGKY